MLEEWLGGWCDTSPLQELDEASKQRVLDAAWATYAAGAAPASFVDETLAALKSKRIAKAQKAGRAPRAAQPTTPTAYAQWLEGYEATRARNIRPATSADWLARFNARFPKPR